LAYIKISPHACVYVASNLTSFIGNNVQDVILIFLGRVIVFIGEKLECRREEANEQDPYPYAMALVKQAAG